MNYNLRMGRTTNTVKKSAKPKNAKKDRGMTMAVMAEHFASEEKAIELIEKMRWPDGPRCVHCGHDRIYRLKGKKCRPGLLKCAACRKQFRVTVGTIFEDSHIPLKSWLIAINLMAASKKGVSSHQVMRHLGIQYRSAWFMTHRIRHTLYDPANKGLFDGIVEADETYVGGKRHGKRGRGAAGKKIAFGLIERGGRVRPFHVPNVTAKTLKSIIREHVKRNAIMSTDEFSSYNGLGKEFKKHWVVNHGAKEYVRGKAHTNSMENFWSILKRGIVGIYQHCGSKYFSLYLNEFAYRFNTREMRDGDRIMDLLRQVPGKRLTFKAPIAMMKGG
jgi:transposase-like protein